MLIHINVYQHILIMYVLPFSHVCCELRTRNWGWGAQSTYRPEESNIKRGPDHWPDMRTGSIRT